jgi:ATP-dependent RNA helicase RhlE
VGEEDKRRTVRQIIRDRSITQALVFVNSKLGAARLARAFDRDGLRTAALHGDKSQDERLKALDAFKRGETDVLVATDVAARGLDIADLPAVFNYDVPFNAEDYVHRIGRTGRAGASGLAVTLVARDDTRLVADIEKLIKKKIELEPMDLDDDRPRRQDEGSRRREGREEGRDESRYEVRRDRSDSPRPAAAWSPPRAPRVATDPFFDRPYEAPAGDAAPAWESRSAAATTAAPKGLSPNIKPKRKVASLLGGKA